MSYYAHHAVVVTGTLDPSPMYGRVFLLDARAKAVELGCAVSDIVRAANNVASFLIAPDGNKEGWPGSAEGDDQRSAWAIWAEAECSGRLSWIEVRFGGDEPHLCRIVGHSWKSTPS